MKKSLFFSLALLICLPAILNAQFERLELQKQKKVILDSLYDFGPQPATLPGLGEIPPTLYYSINFQSQKDTLDALKSVLDDLINQKNKELRATVDSLLERIRILETEEFTRKITELKKAKTLLDANYKRLIKVQTLLEDQEDNPLGSSNFNKLDSGSYEYILLNFYLKKEKTDLALINALGDSLYALLNKATNEIYRSEKEEKLTSELGVLLNECTLLVREADALITSINVDRLQLGNALKQHKVKIKAESEKDTVAQTQFDGLMSTVIPLTGLVFVPSVNIRASRSMDTKYSETTRSSFNAFLFLAPTSFANRDTTYAGVTQKAKNSLLIPELSDFGFKCSYSWSRNNVVGRTPKGIGFTFSGYYLNKNIPVANEQEGIVGYQSVGYCHFVEGIGFNFWNGIFEAYANYNQLVPLHGIDTYQQFFGVNAKPRAFVDMGVSALLNLNGKESKTYLLTRIGFIINHGQIDSLMAQNDKVLAMISISLRPNL